MSRFKSWWTLPRAVVAITLALLLASCGGSSVPLTGVVTDLYSQKPVAGATVRVGEATATTDAAGRFSLADWTKEQTLTAEATDYTSATLALSTTPPAAEGATAVDVSLTIRPSSLAGKLTNQYTNEPAAGVQVSASSGVTATTGPDGSFKLANLPEAFELTVSSPDFAELKAPIQRQTEYSAALRPSVLVGVLTDKYSQKPIAGATISAGAATATTDAEGRYRLAGIAPDQELLVAAGDYTSQTLKIPAGMTFDLALRPSTVKGVVTDKATGKPLSKARVIAMPKPEWPADATKPYTGTAVAMTWLEADGSYVLNDVPENAQIQVLAPGYRKALTTFKEGEFVSDLAAEPFIAKALYVTAATGSSRSGMTEIFEMADRTEINALVVDVKLDFYNNVGGVGYISKLPIVQEAGTAEDYLDMEWLVSEAHKHDIYLIARMAVMRDNRLADARPEWAAKNANTGEVWEDHGGLKWLDPFNPNVKEYNVSLAKEIASYGFDEIQFDYIRFPSDGSTSNLRFSKPIDPENNPEVMYEAIGAVLTDAHDAIHGAGAFFSIDVFGYATWRNMWEIGQSLEIMADHTDYVCAMVYPSHYDRNELGFDNADAHPYEIVKDSIEKGQKRMETKYAVQRPWLQGFTATWLDPVTTYGRAELQAQFRAVDEVPGTHGWIIWNAANIYDEGWFSKE
ncbi:MAG TPA: putative glycoside hydrolase [Herpetosiphonaceae bacterium]